MLFSVFWWFSDGFELKLLNVLLNVCAFLDAFVLLSMKNRGVEWLFSCLSVISKFFQFLKCVAGVIFETSLFILFSRNITSIIYSQVENNHELPMLQLRVIPTIDVPSAKHKSHLLSHSLGFQAVEQPKSFWSWFSCLSC